MAMTPEQIAAFIAKIRANPSDSGYGNGIDLRGTGGAYMDQATGQGLIPIYDNGSYNGSDNFTQNQIGWRTQDTKKSMDAQNKAVLNGTEYQNLDMDGKQTGTGTWSGLKKGNALSQFLTALTVAIGGPMAGAALTGAPLLGAGAAGAGAGGGLGAAGAVAGDAVLPGALASTGGWAVPYGSLIPGLESYAAAAGGALGGAAGADVGASGGYGVAGDAYMPGATSIGGDLGTAAPLQGLDAYAVGGTAATGAGTGASTASSTLAKAGTAASSLLGQNGLGGLAALAGGVLGSKGQEQSASQTTKMDPRMDPYIYGDPQNKGLLQYAQQTLAQQMDPTRMAGYKAMQNQGMGLMSGANVGNGFSKFSSR